MPERYFEDLSTKVLKRLTIHSNIISTYLQVNSDSFEDPEEEVGADFKESEEEEERVGGQGARQRVGWLQIDQDFTESHHLSFIVKIF